MLKNKSVHCYNCRSVILVLPEMELLKLNGFNFVCECCGHQNTLNEFKCYKGTMKDPYLNTFSIEKFAIV
ncbi:MAG: hypothetical protein N3B21_07995 [Clostridia bacterium]|nr:hypothetical protein [Clostridia bacterium]